MWSLSIAYIMHPTWWTLWLLILASFYIGIMSLERSTWGPYLAFSFFFSSYIFTCQLVVGVLLTLAFCIGDTCLLTILAYIKDYNPKRLLIIIIIRRRRRNNNNHNKNNNNKLCMLYHNFKAFLFLLPTMIINSIFSWGIIVEIAHYI